MFKLSSILQLLFLGFALNGFSQTAYIANHQDGTVKIINTNNNSIVGNIDLQYGLMGVAVSPDGNRVYITNNIANTIDIISTATNSEIVALPTDIGPTNIIVSHDNSKAYFSVGLKLYEIDAVTNSISNSVNLAKGIDGLAISNDGSKIYVACSDPSSNFIKIVNTATHTISNTIALSTSNKPYQLLLSHDGSKLYIANTDLHAIQIMNTSNNSITNTIDVPNGVINMCLNAAGTKLYVSGGDVINTQNNTVMTSITNIGEFPTGISITPDDSKLIFTNNHRSTFVVASTQTNTSSAIVTMSQAAYTDPLCMGGNFISIHNPPTGIEETDWAEKSNIYPNPSHGNFILALPMKEASIMICDATGREIMQSQTHENKTALNLELKGFYTVKVTSAKGCFIKKLVIE